MHTNASNRNTSRNHSGQHPFFAKIIRSMAVHTLDMSKPVITFVFKVLYAMDCFGTYFTHVRTCDNVRVQSATQWTASVHTLHMSKRVITFVFKVLYAMDCFGTYFAHVQTCDNVKCYAMDCFGTYFTHVQTCDNVRVQSATQWTASVHTLRMSKPVITFVFKVLRNGLLRYILYTCPNL